MNFTAKCKQFYRYERNWKKVKSRQKTIDSDQNLKKQLAFYSNFIEKGDLCYDIGANIGDKTDLFLRLGARVVAVEPQESCWRVIKRRFGKGYTINIEGVAIASTAGKRPFFLDKSDTLSTLSKDWISTVKKSGRFPNHKWTDQVLVETVTLDSLIGKYGKPKFCKIDVEGFELEVLKGLSQPIDIISYEFVSERVGACINCINYLADLGDPRFNYCLGDADSFASREWLTAKQIRDSIALMEGELTNFGDMYVRFQ